MSLVGDTTRIHAYGLEGKVESALQLLIELLPGLSHRLSDARKLMELSFACGCEEYGEMEAVHWAEGFQFPCDITKGDLAELQSNGMDLVSLVRKRQLVMGKKRLSLESIERISKSDPDYSRLVGLVEGLRIFVAADFRPNMQPPPLRRKYLRVAPAVNKVMMELYENGSVLFTPTSIAVTLPNVHFSSTHWTTKSGKAKGRPLGDCSNAESGSVLNSFEAKCKVDDFYGKIEHPTLQDLMEMITRQEARVGRDQVACWKIDLAGAFTLMFIHPDDVHLAAFELTDDISMFYITGFFGGTGTPASFQVISRVLGRHINSVISGEVKVYVDDIMGCCSKTEVEADMAKAIQECEGLLGEDSVADDKSEASLNTGKLTWIGWEVNLTTWTVSIGKKNFLKTLYGFFTINEDDQISIKSVQRLASWASRYSTICRVLRPYTSNLYAETAGMYNGSVRKRLGSRARFTIRLWRVILCMMELQSSRFCRSISSFSPNSSSYVVEYDASLTGLGIILYKICDPLGPPLLWKVCSVDTPFKIDRDASYQNAMEFTAIVLALAMLAQLGVRQASINIRGDNISSLSWALSERFSGLRSQRASIIYIALGISFDLVVGNVTHIAGVNNTRCDRLSRGVSPQALGHSDVETILVRHGSVLYRLLTLCDPVNQLSEESEFIALWADTNKLLPML